MFSQQTASGLAADLEVSTENFGMRLGVTPRGFLVQDYTGSVRLRLGNGPISIAIDRDRLRDTLLSYAGTRDPVTNAIWGGVMANSAAVNGNWGTAKSGIYLGAGYQYITGKNVATNRRFDATAGAYWRVYRRREGALTAGINLFGMSYQKNLRYFTFGQGGYFSPQRFYLYNVPVRWAGDYHHVKYAVSGSIGTESFHEELSPLFPISSPLQRQSGPFYPNFSNSGASYSFDARAAYQIAPNWFAGALVETNNARFYTLTSLSAYVKYSFEPRPTITDYPAPSVPDWKGRQPFGLP
jgi:hypothetical protein